MLGGGLAEPVDDLGVVGDPPLGPLHRRLRLGPARVEDPVGPGGRWALQQGLNLFDLWQVVLVGIRLAMVTGTPRTRALVTELVPWLVWTALGALAAPGAASTSE